MKPISLEPLTLREDLPLDTAMEVFVQSAHRRSWNIGFVAGFAFGRAAATGEPLPPELAAHIGEMVGDDDE